MKRKIYNDLLLWKKQWNGKTALLIDGARRIGKSYIAEKFGKNEYKSYILIDFNNVDSEVLYIFEHYLTNPDEFFMRLSIHFGVKLYERESLIIFDEVQIYPKARAAIKYLVKDGRYDYIETGSLVSINFNVKNIVIPSEEVRLNMYPMDFEEFMWANEQTMLIDFAKRQFQAKQPVGQGLHRKLMDFLRMYMLVGGMPQAVETYIKEKDMEKVDTIKRSIISLYRNDISKYAGRSAPKVTAIFDNIPALLQQHEKRFRPSQMRKGARMKDFIEPMFWLNESRTVNFCYNTTEPSVALALNKDDSKVKLYLADTGLLVSLAFNCNELQKGGIYEKILRGKLELNKGMLVENLVAQLLISNNHPLYFYSSYSKENAQERMEIDFLIRKEVVTSKHNICPVEVKSSTRYTLSSLDKFRHKFDKYLSTSIVLHTKDLEVKDKILYLPLYMAGML